MGCVAGVHGRALLVSVFDELCLGINACGVAAGRENHRCYGVTVGEPTDQHKTACLASHTRFCKVLNLLVGGLLPVGVDFANMYTNQILNEAAWQRGGERELDRMFGDLVVLELILQLLNRPR